jgi:hypothetical protein
MSTMFTNSPLEIVLLALIGGFALLLIIRLIRLRLRRSQMKIICGNHSKDDIPPVVERRYTCTTQTKFASGECAEGWWDHWWNDRPYCEDVEFWCVFGGGKFEKAAK